MPQQSCTYLNARKHWCRAPALPGKDACRHHIGTERPDYHPDTYRAADQHEDQRQALVSLTV